MNENTKSLIKAVILILLLITPFEVVLSQNLSVKEKLINEMYSSVNKALTFQFKLKDSERINGEIIVGEENIKLSLHPYQIYFYTFKPDKGVEVLWVEGLNKGKAWVHPNSFPYITLSLDPYGSLMNDGHHTMFDLNFRNLVDIISSTQKNLGNNFYKYISVDDDVNFDGRPCYKISFNFPGFKMIDYIVGNNENIDLIAKKLHLSKYMVLEKNPAVKGSNDIRKGQHIIIPNNYFSKLVLYIDKETKYPLVEMFYDEIGLFEKYEFFDFKVNVVFSKMDFSKDNPYYHF